MVIQKGGLRPQRGRTISLTTDPDISATTLLSQAVKKMKDFNKDVKDGPFLLLYPDGTEVIKIPGTQRPFTLVAYKAMICASRKSPASPQGDCLRIQLSQQSHNCFS
ncbi:hypothetical protein XENOCAPTIV_000035 [Xenoophorus captivus]|uniref:Uncharacterized protein n=1 Tax=Xenoophorus captivus TaxID=1517983 RepID=A0ABV0Q745_9TELE